MKAILVALAGFAASAMGHGFVYNFTTDGKFNQGFLGTLFRSSISLTASPI